MKVLKDEGYRGLYRGMLTFLIHLQVIQFQYFASPCSTRSISLFMRSKRWDSTINTGGAWIPSNCIHSQRGLQVWCAIYWLIPFGWWERECRLKSSGPIMRHIMSEPIKAYSGPWLKSHKRYFFIMMRIGRNSSSFFRVDSFNIRYKSRIDILSSLRKIKVVFQEKLWRTKCRETEQ